MHKSACKSRVKECNLEIVLEIKLTEFEKSWPDSQNLTMHHQDFSSA